LPPFHVTIRGNVEMCELIVSFSLREEFSIHSSLFQNFIKTCSRMQTKRKEEQVKIVKRAAAIARDVRKFWEKSFTIVNYIVREQIDAKKREKLDKELNFFVGQSEKFAKMLVERNEEDGSLEASGRAGGSVLAGGTSGEAGGGCEREGGEELLEDDEVEWLGDSDVALSAEEEDADEATLEAEEALAAAAGDTRRGAAEVGAHTSACCSPPRPNACLHRRCLFEFVSKLGDWRTLSDPNPSPCTCTVVELLG
jgi:hypothetical protein